MRARHDAMLTPPHHAGSSKESEAQRRHTPRLARSRANGALAILAIAASIAIMVARYMRQDAGQDQYDTLQGIRQQTTRSADPIQDCSARYAALLDLAELARRDGKASEVVMRGLSDRRGALNGCLQPLLLPAPYTVRDATASKPATRADHERRELAAHPLPVSHRPLATGN